MTPQQIRSLSNIGHSFEGALLTAVGLFILIEVMRPMPHSRLRLFWPMLLVAAGVLLPVFLLAVSDRPPLDTVAFLVRDVQQREHVWMALALIVAGLAETWRRRMQRRAGWWVWPAMLMTIGGLLMIHTQYGTPEAVRWARRQHVYHGALTILAGICLVVAHVRNRAGRIGAIAGPLVLLAAGILLLMYREPPGAFERSPAALHVPSDR